MPIYVFVCKECGKVQELVTSYEDRDDKKTCTDEECDGELKREEVSATGNMSLNWSKWRWR